MTRRLAEMTSAEIEAAVAAGGTTVILPLGATEQHGPHLPMATDSIRAAALADRLAAAMADALVAPTLPVGCSDEHSGFAGLLSLDHRTLTQVIVDCGIRMAGWGVRRLVLLSAHGGNEAALSAASAQLTASAPSLRIVVLRMTTALSDALIRTAAADGISADAFGLHAGDGETSELLHLRPDLVHMDRAVAGYSGGMAAILPRLRHSGVRPVTPIGTLGDPSRACAARGVRYLAIQVNAFAQQVAAAAEGLSADTEAGGRC